jgi:hypothetical protein
MVYLWLSPLWLQRNHHRHPPNSNHHLVGHILVNVSLETIDHVNMMDHVLGR